MIWIVGFFILFLVVAVCTSFFDVKDAEQVQVGSKCSFIKKTLGGTLTIEATVIQLGSYGKYLVKMDNVYGYEYADIHARRGVQRWITQDETDLEWLSHPPTQQQMEDTKLAMRLLKEYKESERQLGL